MHECRLSVAWIAIEVVEAGHFLRFFVLTH